MLRQLAATALAFAVTTIGQEIRGMIFSHVHDATSFRPQPPQMSKFQTQTDSLCTAGPLAHPAEPPKHPQKFGKGNFISNPFRFQVANPSGVKIVPLPAEG